MRVTLAAYKGNAGIDRQHEQREGNLLLGIASAVGDGKLAEVLEGLLILKGESQKPRPEYSVAAKERLASTIADIEGDDAVPFFEKAADDTTLGKAARKAAVCALGRLHSEKSAAAYARLRDAAYGTPGAPERRASYTHEERMVEAAVMAAFVIPTQGDSKAPQWTANPTPATVSVNEDYRTGTLALNNMEFRLHRVGREWLVASARNMPVYMP